MQTGRRRSHRTEFFCIDGLVAFFVQWFGGPGDIFWQRRIAQVSEVVLKFFIRAVKKETDGSAARGCIIHYFSYEDIVAFSVTEIELVSYPDLPGGVHEHIPKPGFVVEFAQ